MKIGEYNFHPADEEFVERISQHNWAIRSIPNASLPYIVERDPRHLWAIASGSLLLPREIDIEGRTYPTVAGLSYCALDPSDIDRGGLFNVYGHAYIPNPFTKEGIGGRYLSVGPLPSSHFWYAKYDDVPVEFKNSPEF